MIFKIRHALASVLWMVCASVPPALAQQASGARVEVAVVEQRELTRDVAAVGSLVARDAVMLRAEISGRIAEIGFQEGRPVQKGQVLIQLDDAMARAQLQQAQANLNLVGSQHKRSSELSRQGFISQQARDESGSRLAVQRAELDLARVQLDKTRIRAPFDGVAGLRHVSVGDYVGPGTDLVQVQDIASLNVDFRIPEQYLADVRAGMPVELRFDAFPGQPRMGTVLAVSPVVDAAGRSILLRAQVPNDDGALRPGLFARVRLELSRQQALMVPETALAPAGQSQFVYVVKDGRALRRQVEVGLRQDAWVQVSGDLKAGENVLVAGLQKVSDGVPVDIQEIVDTQIQPQH
ncbi:efflux RND transporter periplasmic adaptor subunit [Alcaligenes sp. SDU_A2]|uniref:efflux RND transporter periplasmic adaptor subunit n=1 Tax=Alcaligenes sp. SDU_A2 TaxID=3136634 RepID=UPI002BBBAA0C|nr:efflux RND transporter periplasmic adaptor subunit [Alcaligenes sp.]HRL27731.1 efflux RND transporter periplasmic adaptor subunit [Alcaligenes sp.]